MRSLVTNACYRLLEKPAVVKKVTTRDAICWLLGTAVSKYNHGLSKDAKHWLGFSVICGSLKRLNVDEIWIVFPGCSIKLIQLLQLFEHLAPFVALAVSTFATEFNFKTVASDMIRLVRIL
jgi:condensin complex subunit 1